MDENGELCYVIEVEDGTNWVDFDEIRETDNDNIKMNSQAYPA